MKTLITIKEAQTAIPFQVKTLAPNARHSTVVARFLTWEEAIAEIDRREAAEPETYERVTEYRMKKEETAI